MTPGQAQWMMWLFGAVCGVACGGLVASMLYRSQRLRLRVALERLVDAVDSGNWRPYRDTETGRRTLEALARARDVLSGKGAE